MKASEDHNNSPPPGGVKPVQSPANDLLIVLLLASLALGVFLFRARSESVLVFPDAMEYAQLGRSLASGEGFISRTLWVLHTAYSTELPAPEYRRSPGLPFLESLVFRMVRPGDRAAIITAGVPFILSIPLLYLLARRFLPAVPSLAAAGLLLFDSRSLDFAVSGLSEPLFGLMLIVLALALTIRNPLHAALAAGAILGLSQYVRGNAFVLLLPLLAVLGLPLQTGERKARLRQALAAFALFVVFANPLLIRNTKALGRFDFTGYQSASAVNHTGVYPDHYAERSFEYISPLGFALEHPGAMTNKLIRDLGLNINSFAQSAPPIVIGLAFGWLLLGQWTRPISPVVLFGLGSAALSVVFFSIGEFEGPRFYVPFVPLLILAAVHAGWTLTTRRDDADHHNRLVQVCAWLLPAITLLPGVLSLVQARPDRTSDEAFRVMFGREIANRVPVDGVIACDVPWVAAWYADRTSVWLPYGPEEMAKLGKRLPVAWVCLSGGVRSSDEVKPEWGAIHAGSGSLPGYTRHATLPGGFVLFKKVD